MLKAGVALQLEPQIDQMLGRQWNLLWKSMGLPCIVIHHMTVVLGRGQVEGKPFSF